MASPGPRHRPRAGHTRPGWWTVAAPRPGRRHALAGAALLTLTTGAVLILLTLP